MANILSFNICQSADCTKIYFSEDSGAYSSSANTGGWGAPNSTTAQAETATLLVEYRNSATGTYTTLATLNIFPQSFPTTNKNQEHIILSSDLGYGTNAKLPDGEYKVTYTVARTTATAFSYSQVKKFFIYCQVKCCVYNMFADALNNSCNCQDSKQNEALTALATFQSLVNASKCGQTTSFFNLLTILNNLCADSDCLGCK